MKKQTTAPKGASKEKPGASGKSALAKGAEAIRKAEAAAAKAATGGGKPKRGAKKADANAGDSKPAAKSAEFELVGKDTGPQVGDGGQLEMVAIIPSDRPAVEIIAEKVKVLCGGVGLQVSEDMTPEEMATVIRHYAGLQTHLGFMLGDLLIFAESHYGKKYASVVEATGYKYQTLANFLYVARKVTPEHRRKELPFSHHAEVAALPPGKQDKVLSKAAKDELPLSKVKEIVKTEKGGKKRNGKGSGDAGKGGDSGAGSTGVTGGESGAETGTLPPQPNPKKERQLTDEERDANTKALEAVDTLVDHLKSPTYKGLPPSHRRQWRDALQYIVEEEYKALVLEFGPPKRS